MEGTDYLVNMQVECKSEATAQIRNKNRKCLGPSAGEDAWVEREDEINISNLRLLNLT